MSDKKSDKKSRPSSRRAADPKPAAARKPRTGTGSTGAGSARPATSTSGANKGGRRRTAAGSPRPPKTPTPGPGALVPEIALDDDGIFADFQAASGGASPASEAGAATAGPEVGDDGAGVGLDDDGIALEDDGIVLEDDGIVLEDDGIVLEDDGVLFGDEEAVADAPAKGPATGEPTLLPGGGALVRLDPLGRYLLEVRRYPPLDRDAEVRLARAFRETGDRDSAQRLVTANLLLVVKIARLFRRAVVNVLDLIQEGNVGLLHALDRYDPEVGVKFSTYASWWIKAYILKYLLDNTRLVRVGTTNARRKLLYNLNREKRRLEAAGFTAGPKLLAEKFGVTERDVVEVEQSLRGGDIPLDAPVGEDGTTTRGDMLASEAPTVEDEVARRELKELLDAKLGVFRSGLSEKEGAILDARLLADTPATLQEIGDRFGITREAVRQAEKRLTGRLREYLTAELGEEAVLQFRKR